MKTGLISVAGVLFSFLLINGCDDSNKNSDDQLGEIDFSVHASKEAQPFFQKGLLLLYSFEYVDAAENFVKAEELDSTCVMAYWGEAMTYNHPLWRFQDYEKGNAALNKLGKSPEERRSKAASDLEKDFLAAIDQLFGKGAKSQRDSAYAAYLGAMYKKYPGNNEVAAFYSVALLGSLPVGRDDAVYGHAAEIAKEVLSRNPNHPGALHYLIHSYDDPGHASLAMDAADKYAVVAPAAGHALHMPSHIYLALGMWDKVVSSNEASWAATVARKENKKLTNDALGYHYFQWLQYGYLQQDRKEKAKELLDEMKVCCNTLPSIRAREHLVFMKTTYLVETGDWNSDALNISIDMTDINLSMRAMNYFVDGMKAYFKMDGPALSEIVLKLSGERLIDAQKASAAPAACCMSMNSNKANLLDVQQAEVMESELRALHSWMERDTAETENYFKQATMLENSISYSYGPPVIVKPSNELYGEWLLEINKPKEALEQFNLILKAAPNRVLSLKGKMEAAERAGDYETAVQVQKILNEIATNGLEMKKS